MKDEKKAPKLRFKGFTDDWEQVKYGEIFQRRSKMCVSTSALPSVEYDDINPGMGTLNKEPKSKGTSKRGIHFNPGDVLFGKLRPYLKNWLFACFEGVAVGDFWVLTSSKIDHGFTYSLIQAPEFQYIANLSSGSKMPRSDWGLVSNARTFIPTNLSEQKSISSVLFGLDTAITLHEEKKQQLKCLKSALLQKMFANKNKSGDPDVRFKGFDERWERHILNDLAIFNPKGTLPTSFEYVDLGSVIGVEMISHKTISKFDAPSRAQRLAQVGDLFYQTVRPYQQNNYLFDNKDNAYVFSTGYAQLRPLIDGYFLLCLVQTKSFVRKVMNACTGTSYPAINSQDLAQIGVNIPINSKEQRLIGNLYKVIDNLITLYQQKLDDLNTIKQSLLQKMFI
ncbi:restriction endonuclease subunit S [Lactobacillus delbrueckii]|uniref:restriction endonuclease subunit S n=1 Tax=Lactobacillus delbrueckii TaxID=1584 RepID=UPI003A8490EF